MAVYLANQVMGGGTHKCIGIPQTAEDSITFFLHLWNCCQFAKGRIYVQCWKQEGEGGREAHVQHNFSRAHL